MKEYLATPLAGSIAGIIEHVSIYPIDTLKTRQQSFYKPNNLLKSNLLKGCLQFSTGIAPAHIAYFATYEYLNKKNQNNDIILSFLTGTCASISHDLIMIPYDIGKQRVQVLGKTTVYNQMKLVFRNEGFTGLYRGLIPTFSMNIPFASIFVASNEKLKENFFESKDDDNLKISEYAICSGISGFLATTLTMPMDVLKTNMQTVTLDKSIIRNKISLVNSIQNIFNNNGLIGFYRGYGYKLLMQVPASVISWTVYQSLMDKLSK